MGGEVIGAPRAGRAIRVMGALAVALSAAACSGGSAADPPAASSPAAAITARPDKRLAARPRKPNAPPIVASSLPVPEDFEAELRKQITSSNYLEALNGLGSAAAAVSSVPSAHP